MENTTPKKRNPPKDVRDLDRELVELRVNSLLKYLFGAQRDNSRCWIIPPGCSVPGVITSCGFTYPRLNIGGKKFLLSHLVKFIQINTGAHDANADGTDYLLYPGVEREKFLSYGNKIIKETCVLESRNASNIMVDLTACSIYSRIRLSSIKQ
jgi:hypothetical protein